MSRFCGRLVRILISSLGRRYVMPLEAFAVAQEESCDRARTPVAGRMAARWYVIQTQPHAEHRAIFHLERQGYAIYCPRVRKVVRHARKVTNALIPLFPGYLFLQLGANQAWRSVNGTFGVIRLITAGDAPQAVPLGVVENILAHAGDDGSIVLSESLKIGQAVRVTDGPFADLMGTLERLNSAGRARVLLHLLGRSVSVSLRCDALSMAA